MGISGNEDKKQFLDFNCRACGKHLFQAVDVEGVLRMNKGPRMQGHGAERFMQCPHCKTKNIFAHDHAGWHLVRSEPT